MPTSPRNDVAAELRGLVRDVKRNNAKWETLDQTRRIAVCLVLWELHPFLKDLGIWVRDPEGSAVTPLPTLLANAKQLIGEDWCNAVLTVRSEELARELNRALTDVLRHGQSITHGPLRHAVLEVLRRDRERNAIEVVEDVDGHISDGLESKTRRGPFQIDKCLNGQLEAALERESKLWPKSQSESMRFGDDQLLALTEVAQQRCRWSEFFSRFKIEPAHQWAILDLFQRYDPNGRTVFNAVEQKTRPKVLSDIRALAESLNADAKRVAASPIKVSKKNTEEDLMDGAASLCEAADRYKRVATDWYRIERRGGPNLHRQRVIDGLLPIFRETTGQEPRAYHPTGTAPPETRFVEFACEAVTAAGHASWAVGLVDAAKNVMKKAEGSR